MSPDSLPAVLRSLPKLGGVWRPVCERVDRPTVHAVGPPGGPPKYYVKAGPMAWRADGRADLAREAEATAWLGEQGLPVAEVCEVGGNDDLQWLVTTALAGEPATFERPVDDQLLVARSIGGLLAQLHAIEPAGCPFDRRLVVTLDAARQAAAAGHVDLDDLEPHRRGVTADGLLTELRSLTPPPETDVVVCHGDPTQDNILLDPDSLTVTGVVDLERLGVADRWLDLAIAVRSIMAGGRSIKGASQVIEAFLDAYGLVDGVDGDRLDFYTLLDEFF